MTLENRLGCLAYSRDESEEVFHPPDLVVADSIRDHDPNETHDA